MVDTLINKNIFTEYDDSIYLDIKKDPLGLQVIWTYFGQEIFDNKTTSVALDIRSYNINLFNHYVIYKLRQDNDLFKKLFDESKNFTDKKKVERLLLVLENIIIWSWFVRDSYDNNDTWESAGLLGTSKASAVWDKESGKTINLDLSTVINKNKNKLELLKNQKSLGVNGRYKKPFMQMGFFNTEYKYKREKIDKQFSKDIQSEIFGEVEKDIFVENSTFKMLFDKIIEFFKEEELLVEKIPCQDICNLFGKTESSMNTTTKSFWLKSLGLNTNEAKYIYSEISSDKSIKWRKIIYENALNKYELEYSKVSSKLTDIIKTEPKLTYLKYIFDYLLQQNNERINKIEFSNFFHKLESLPTIEVDTLQNNSAKKRLIEINKIKDIQSLIEYHEYIMKPRPMDPWIKIDGEVVKVNQNIKHDDELIEKLKKNPEELEWVHSYYVYSIRNIKKGLGDFDGDKQ